MLKFTTFARIIIRILKRQLKAKKVLKNYIKFAIRGTFTIEQSVIGCNTFIEKCKIIFNSKALECFANFMQI